MDDSARKAVRDDKQAEILLFFVSAFSGVLGFAVFATMTWEISSLRGGLSDKLVPISLIVALFVFPVTAAISFRLYKKCCDGFSLSLRTVVITWHTLLLLAWCIALNAAVLLLYAWLKGEFMWHGEYLAPPSWSPFA